MTRKIIDDYFAEVRRDGYIVDGLDAQVLADRLKTREVTDRKGPEEAIYDVLVDLQGYYPHQVAELLPEKLRAAGYVLVPLQ